MTDKQLFAIAKGDELLLVSGDRQKIETVIRVTPTQIITNHTRFYRVQVGKRTPGSVVGGGLSRRYSIARIATAQDIDVFELEKAKQREASITLSVMENRRIQKLSDLSNLFRHGVYVTDYEHQERDQPKGFEITNLTEQEVRLIADFLKQ